MRKFIESLVCALTGVVILFATAFLGDSSAEEQMLAGRYHQRQHSASALSRSGGNSIRSSRSGYRQHWDHVNPGTAPGQKTPSMIARKPESPVRS